MKKEQKRATPEKETAQPSQLSTPAETTAPSRSQEPTEAVKSYLILPQPITEGV